MIKWAFPSTLDKASSEHITWVKCLLIAPIPWCHCTEDSHYAVVYCNTLPRHATFCELNPSSSIVRLDRIRHDTSRSMSILINILRLRQNGRHFADEIFKCIFWNKTLWNWNDISMKCVPQGIIYNRSSLIQIMALYRTGDKPLFEHMIV